MSQLLGMLLMIDISKLEKTKTQDEIDLENNLNNAISYLKATDWYVIRFMETGKVVPDDIQEKRDAARSLLI